MSIRRPCLRSLAGLAAAFVIASIAHAQGSEGRRYTPGAFDTVVM